MEAPHSSNAADAEQAGTSEILGPDETFLTRVFVGAAPDPIFCKDREGRYLACNQVTLRMFQLSAGIDIIGKTVFEIPGLRANAALYHADDMTVINTGKPIVNREEPFEYPDGRKGWFLTSKYPRYDEQGVIIGLVGVARDITELKTATGELRAMQLRLIDHVENSPLAVIEWDSEFRVLRWAGQAEAMFGWGADEIVGKRFDEWPFVFADDQDQVNAVVSRLLDGRDQRNICHNRNLTKDGRALHCAWQNSVLPDEKGERFYILSLVQDVSDRAAAEEAQRVAAAERQAIERKLQEAQKLESLGVLAGGIAHDFNNLLTGVLGNAGLARMDLPEDSPVQELLEQIESAALKAADLCKQMLAYSGKGRFIVKWIDLNRLIRETTQLLNFSIGKNAEIEFSLADHLPSILGDASQLRQVVMNVVINAAEAMGDRFGAICIATGVTHAGRGEFASCHLAPDLPEGEYVFVEVTDEGPGMAPELAARIFDPFFTTKFTGRGLGLAAVCGIVRGHDGALKVTNRPAGGTSFKILFPCSEAPGSSGVQETPITSAWRAAGTVLIVDDEETVRQTVSRMMESIGFTAKTAENGKIGVEVFCANPEGFNLVIMDLTMPQMDGEAAFRLISARHPGVRVLLMSGYNEQDAISRFTGLGLAGFIQKPFTLDRLREKLREVLTAAIR